MRFIVYLKFLIKGFINHLPKFISLLGIVILGTSVFIGLSTSGKSLEYSSKNYLNEYYLPDLTLEALAQNPYGVNESLKTYLDVETESEWFTYQSKDYQNRDSGEVLRVFAYPEEVDLYDYFHLKSGRLPQNKGEIVLDQLLVGQYKIGQEIELDPGEDLTQLMNQEDTKEATDLLTLKVVGFADSPTYIMGFNRGQTHLADGKVQFFAIVNPQELEAYPENLIAIKSDKNKNRNIFDEAYQDKVDRVAEDLQAQIDKLDSRLAASHRINKSYQLNDIQSLASFSRQIVDLSYIFGFAFLFVVALVAFTVMIRLVNEERVQIGSLRVMGYSKESIFFKYLLNAALIILIGLVIGTYVGYQFYPYLIFSVVRNFIVETIQRDFYWPALYWCGGTCLLFAVMPLMTLLRPLLKLSPIAIILDQETQSGKKLWIEKLSLFWNRLSYTSKIAMRHMLRYPFRSWMIIVGMFACTSLMMISYGIKDSISQTLNNQYQKIEQSDFLIQYPNQEEGFEMGNEDPGYPTIADQTSLFQTLCYSLDKDKALAPIGVKVVDDRVFDQVYNLEGDKLSDYEQDGVVVSNKLARLLDLKIGDYFQVESADGNKITWKIAFIMENHLFHQIYLSKNYYERTVGVFPGYNLTQLLLKENQRLTEDEQEALKEATDYPIQWVDQAETYQDRLKAVEGLNHVSLIMVTISALLAGLVIYCLMTINLIERYREFATAKVLGMSDGQVTYYIFKEIFILTIVACILAYLSSYSFLAGILKLVEEEYMHYTIDIQPISYGKSILLSFCFLLVSSLYYHFQVKKIDIVAALKGMD